MFLLIFIMINFKFSCLFCINSSFFLISLSITDFNCCRMKMFIIFLFLCINLLNSLVLRLFVCPSVHVFGGGYFTEVIIINIIISIWKNKTHITIIRWVRKIICFLNAIGKMLLCPSHNFLRTRRSRKISPKLT